jgi:glycosyltransferase involved in cell wall biosynthesis
MLGRTLAQMRNLRISPDVEWELLIVNNNCSDETDTVIAQYAHQLPIRRLFEPALGISPSRNRALSSATGDLILFTDDDILVSPEWLVAYAGAAQDWPLAGFFGGTVQPWFVVPPPAWIKQNLQSLEGVYALRQFGDDVRPFVEGEMPFGANMGFRVAAINGLGFNDRLGAVGAEQLRGEETDFVQRLARTGAKGVWVGNASVQHYIPPERLTTQYVWNWYSNSGRTYVRMKQVRACKLLGGAPRWVVRKYWEARLKTWALAVRRTPAWCRNYCSAAFLEGVILESRAQRIAADCSAEIDPRQTPEPHMTLQESLHGK